jgi:glycosyltransferase involved in cell wall biosynthesis
MKIAFIGSRGIPALYGGFETATEEIGARLAERGHDVTVYCRDGNGDRGEGMYRGMQKVYVPCVRKRSLETLSHTFFALLHAFFRSYDALIIMNPANGVLCWIPRLRGTPFALHVDGLDWERSRWPWIGQKFIRFGAWCGTKIAPILIADSHGIAEYYRKQWGRETVYASYGADVQSEYDSGLLEPFGLEELGYYLVVARLEPENHTNYVIECYRRLETGVPLVIVGDTNYGGAYTEALKGAGDAKVRFLGRIDEREVLESLLHHSLLYVHGHSVGGTNPVLLQAMACSCAIAFLDVPFNREVVGETGFGFGLEDGLLEGVFQDALNNGDFAGGLRVQTCERVREQYSWKQAADAYESLCTALINE